MKYVIKNLKSFVRTEKMIFLLIILCVSSSAIIINFAFGLYQNYNIVKTDEESGLKSIGIEIVKSDMVTKDILKECLFSISESTNNNIDMYYVSPIIEPFYSNQDLGWGSIHIRFTIKQNKIAPCTVFKENMERDGTIISGNYFSDIQESTGQNVVIVSNDSGDELSCTDSIVSRVEGDKQFVTIQGKEYEVIGIYKMANTPLIPFNSLDDSTQFQEQIMIGFAKSITRSQYDEIRNSFQSYFGEAISIPELDIPETENYYLYNTIILISFFIALLAAINFAVLYKYILEKRKKSIVIFRICGCRRSKALGIFLSECMLITIPVFVISTSFYSTIILPILDKSFKYIKDAYNIEVYIIIFAIYIITSIIVLSAMIIFSFQNKSLMENRKGGF